MASGLDKTFTTLPNTPVVTPPNNSMHMVEDVTHVVNTPTLEVIRQLEMTAMGRFYIDEQGNARYEDRYYRNNV